MFPLLRTILGLTLVAIVARVGALLGRFQQQHAPKKAVPRRMFLRNVVLGSVGVVSLQAAAGFVYWMWPLKTGAFGSVITVPASVVPEVGAAPYRDQAGKFWLINNEDGLLALYWKCPHLGCTVPWEDGQGDFQCPCHGSIYDRFGVLIAGPAPRPMDYMALTVEGGNVNVDTGDIIQRSGYDPSQSVPYTA
jgi:cytochrome b6-f complex iron-sulfur subunit